MWIVILFGVRVRDVRGDEGTRLLNLLLICGLGRPWKSVSNRYTRDYTTVSAIEWFDVASTAFSPLV